MPIHEKERKPKSNHYFPKYGGWKFGQGILSPPQIQFLFTFPSRKEKRTCVSMFAWTGPMSAWMHSHICIDVTRICTDRIFLNFKKNKLLSTLSELLMILNKGRKGKK